MVSEKPLNLILEPRGGTNKFDYGGQTNIRHIVCVISIYISVHFNIFLYASTYVVSVHNKKNHNIMIKYELK